MILTYGVLFAFGIVSDIVRLSGGPIILVDLIATPSGVPDVAQGAGTSSRLGRHSLSQSETGRAKRASSLPALNPGYDGHSKRQHSVSLGSVSRWLPVGEQKLGAAITSVAPLFLSSVLAAAALVERTGRGVVFRPGGLRSASLDGFHNTVMYEVMMMADG